MPTGAPYRPADAVTVALAVLGPAVLMQRQTRPVVTLAVAGLVVVVHAGVGGAIGFLDWPAWIAFFTCFDVGDRRVRAAATAITVLAIAGYVVLERGGPVGSLPGSGVHFLLARVVGDLSSRRAWAAATEAQRPAGSRQQALAAERLLLQEAPS